MNDSLNDPQGSPQPATDRQQQRHRQDEPRPGVQSYVFRAAIWLVLALLLIATVAVVAAAVW